MRTSRSAPASKASSRSAWRLQQSERYGTPLGQSLRVMAQENRDMRMNEAEKKAAALPPKLTVPMILFFLPVLFVVILGPTGIKVAATALSAGASYGGSPHDRSSLASRAICIAGSGYAGRLRRTGISARASVRMRSVGRSSAATGAPRLGRRADRPCGSASPCR